MTLDAVHEPASGFPPGPKVPAALQTLLFARRRTRWLDQVRHRYGDLFTVRIPPYADRMVVVSRPEHVRQVFAANASQVHAGEGNHVLAGLMGHHSVFVLDEDAHARIRKLMLPAFNGAAIRSYRQLVADIAIAEIATWDGLVLTHERMNDLALELIVQVVFGVTDDACRLELLPLLRQQARIHPIVLAGLEHPRLQTLGPWRRFRMNESGINEILYEQIAARRRCDDLADRPDVLSRILASGAGEEHAPLTDQEVRDQLVSLLLAGHETTASALSWSLYELAINPTLQDQARCAALDGDDRYIDAIFKEALRAHVVISGAYRRLTTDMTFDHWQVPAGTYVTTSALLAHRSTDTYPDPEVFRPQRFLDGGVPPNAWFPFGGGARRCVGAAFAQLEATVVLREVLARQELTAADAAPERHRLRNVTYVPAGGAPVIATALSEVHP
ncbi:cytochrome P450 [Nocardia nova]|uniref:cytochrome P450 n=1 Tax=Nocardia nova TaxID=37330 RepID=UPI0033D713BF